jgi:putative cell wall-binding protein
MAGRLTRVLALAALLGALLIGAGATPAHANVPCPTLDGWVGPTESPSSFEGEGGGQLHCWYDPGPGMDVPSTTQASITASWLGRTSSGGGVLGCGAGDSAYAATRVVASDGYWAAITYGISGAGATEGEAILVANQEPFARALAELWPHVEAVAAPCAGTSGGSSTPVAPTQRVAGTNRYETATAISQVWDYATTYTVYVATGANFPDALGGGPAAAVEGAPILLVESNGIPATTASELARLQPYRIVVLGGTGVISDAVLSSLGAYAETVDRVASVNRYATAAAVSSYAFPGAQPTVYVASGRSFADPIIAGAAAALDGAPLLLVDGLAPLESAVALELARMQPSEIVVVGSDADLSGVLGSLPAYGSVSRISGADVYARSAALWDEVSGPVNEVVLATSSAFADALAGTPYAAREPVSYLMLSRPDCVPAAVRSQMERLQPSGVLLLGGTAALSSAIESQTTC